MTKPFSVFSSPMGGNSRKRGEGGLRLLLHIKVCGYFEFSLCLAHTYIQHTHPADTSNTTVKCFVILQYCSRCNFYDFEASHTHTHRTLIHTPTTRLRLGIPLFYCLLFCNPFSESSNKSSSFCYLLTLRKRKNIKGTARVCVCVCVALMRHVCCCIVVSTSVDRPAKPVQLKKG